MSLQGCLSMKSRSSREEIVSNERWNEVCARQIQIMNRMSEWFPERSEQWNVIASHWHEISQTVEQERTNTILNRYSK